MQSRIRAILACVLVMLILASLIALYGYDETWELWGIPTMTTHFADLRTITGGAESYAQGFDPMIFNPGDPGLRTLNYPRIWQSLYFLGVDQSHTIYMGSVFILLFIVGVCLILPRAGYDMIVLVMAAVLSPAVLLGFERGNTDLFMFFLAAFSVVIAKRWYALSALTVLIGFVLKLFPIFGCAVLLGSNRSTFFKYALAILALATLYVVLTYSDLVLIKANTPQGINNSYGLNVLWMNLVSLDPTIAGYARYLSYLALLLSMWHASTALLRADFMSGTPSQEIYIDSFRVGAAIYVGTFLLGNNFDYRLMFLIFTIPQLAIWAKGSAKSISASSILVLSSIFISLWYLMIVKITFGLPYGSQVSFFVDEISHWIVFAGLLYLFIWSMPAWIKDYAQKLHYIIWLR